MRIILPTSTPFKILQGTALLCTLVILSGCANTLNKKTREDMSSQPPRYEAPYDQIPQPTVPRYALDYSTVTLSDTRNDQPRPVEIYPDNYRTEDGLNPGMPNVLSSQRPLEAIPAPNKPGFVISPYAPEAGLIDAREFSPGSEAKDPFTGRTFLMPINVQKKPPTKVDLKTNVEDTGSGLLKRKEDPKPKTPEGGIPGTPGVNPPLPAPGAPPAPGAAPAPPAPPTAPTTPGGAGKPPEISVGPPLAPR
jgi:hypothetical protein